MSQQTDTAADPRGDALATVSLSIGAVILMALVAVQGLGLFAAPAQAEMTAKVGSYSAMTTLAANRELLYVIDDRAEQLMVFEDDNARSLNLIAREDLAQLFSAARQMNNSGNSRRGRP